MISFLTDKLRKKLFWTNNIFLTPQSKKNSWKKYVNNRWKHPSNSLRNYLIFLNFSITSQLIILKGGYVPGLILDPEEGIEAAIYAKNKAIDYSFINEDNAGFGMPLGFQGMGENDSEDVGGMKVYGGNSLADAAMSIGMVSLIQLR